MRPILTITGLQVEKIYETLNEPGRKTLHQYF